MKRKCRIIKDWGGFEKDSVIMIGEPKAGILKMQGFVEFIDDAEEKPKAEKATAPPMAERATAEPQLVNKTEVTPKHRGRKPKSK